MQKVVPSHRSDLAHCEEPSDRQFAHLLLNSAGIVVGRVEEALSTPVATEDQGADRRLLPLHGTLGAQELMKVFAGRRRIPKLELDCLALFYDIADGKATALLISADKVSDEKISPVKMVLVFINHDAQMECPLSLPLFRRRE